MAVSAADLRYPVGRFERPTSVSASDRDRFIDEIESLPARFRAAVGTLSEEQLDTPYREGGWTVRQLAHHVPDSHLNAYVRFKLALTEDTPVIKTYAEARWAELPDARGPVDMSLDLLQTLHRRWVTLLRAMDEKDWARAFRHPEWGSIRLDTTLALYAWHSRHHLAHVTELRRRNGW
jgi:uncharacterized damage-inducible protein DinB